jgi:hypothetical protein
MRRRPSSTPGRAVKAAGYGMGGDHRVVGKPGAPDKAKDNDNIIIKPKQGTSRAYTLDRRP